MALQRRLISTQRYHGIRLDIVVSRPGRHIFRNIDQDRPLPARTRDIKCLVDNAPKLSGPLHEIIVFGNGKGNPGNIRFLKRIPSKKGGGNLSGDGNDRS